jgi:nicotinate-nucleotide pyrophosphorylase (carboxylating)
MGGHKEFLLLPQAPARIRTMTVAESDELAELLALARREDFGEGDLSTQLLDAADRPAEFRLIARESCVFAGVPIAPAILAAYDPSLRVDFAQWVADGVRVEVGGAPSVLGRVRGPLGAILSAERVLLNFLQRLCGVATLTRRFVDAIAGTGAQIFDTRKSIPGWRALDKYAVRCGGGSNHRMGLYDAVMLKDNHFSAMDQGRFAGAVFDALNRLGERRETVSFVAVEAQNLQQVEELFKVVGVDVIVLDNFDLQDLSRAVELRDSFGLRGRVTLEASGGVRLSNVRAIAETGVERISVGAMTHSALAIDLALERC